jgi:hypothetical protein
MLVVLSLGLSLFCNFPPPDLILSEMQMEDGQQAIDSCRRQGRRTRRLPRYGASSRVGDWEVLLAANNLGRRIRHGRGSGGGMGTGKRRRGSGGSNTGVEAAAAGV